MSPEVRQSVELLRNIWEHWDEQRETFQTEPVKSGRRFRSAFPGHSPWSYGYSSDPAVGTRVGGVLHLEALAAELDALASLLQPQLEQAMHDAGLLPYNGPAVNFDSVTGPARTPEELAVRGFGGRAVVASCIQQGDQAVVLALADVEPNATVPHAPWLVTAQRVAGGWRVVGCGGGSGGWADGVLYAIRPAPAGTTAARVRYQDKETIVPVREGWVLWAEFEVPVPDDDILITFDEGEP